MTEMQGARWLVATALFTGPAAPLQAAPATYTLDPAHSWVHFELLHFGTSTIRGRIGPVQGEVSLDRPAATGEVSLRIPTATVDTGLAVFNARIREPDLLSTTAWPDAYFVARRFRFDGDRLAEVRGEFTLRGVGQPLSLRAIRFACRPADPDASSSAGGEICGGDFEGEINRADFGATFGLPFIASRVRLIVQVEGRTR
jgi:polyisoprenoid-binding protein YceI